MLYDTEYSMNIYGETGATTDPIGFTRSTISPIDGAILGTIWWSWNVRYTNRKNEDIYRRSKSGIAELDCK